MDRYRRTKSDENALAGCIGGIGCLAAIFYVGLMALGIWAIIELVLWVKTK